MKTFLTISLATLMALPAAADRPTAKSDKGKPRATTSAPAEELYRKATRALDAERWDEAIRLFDQAARSGGGDAARALFWMAHAQHRSGRPTEALSTISTLKQKHPKSAWVDDARALEVEIRGTTSNQVRPENVNDDADLKLIAITSLMHADPARAVPLLEKMLRDRSSEDVQERALFVLGQIQTPEAAKVLESAARGAYGPELQEDAIRSIATGSNRNKRSLLVEIYQGSRDEDVKEAVLQAFMILGDRERLLTVATTEADPELREDAVRLLGTMGATVELGRLYQTEKNGEVKEAIIQGFFIAGDVTRLATLAREETDAGLREAAIRGLGTSGAQRAGALLLELWNGARDANTKEAIVEAFFIQGNATQLIALARKEQDREVKKEIVQKLSLMNSKEARAYMVELLGQ